MRYFEILGGDDPMGHRWGFCYLHGKAEDVELPNTGSAPDIFTASIPIPTEPGIYPCTIAGQKALAVLDIHLGRIGGRVSLVSDTPALEHALTPEDWA